MAAKLSDQVWSRLDPSAGRLPRRARRRVTTAVVALAALLLGAVPVGESGVIRPRVGTGSGWSGRWEYGETSNLLVNRYLTPATTHVSQSFTIVNNGWHALEIIGVDTDRPGMRVERVAIGSTHWDAQRGMWRAGGANLTAADPYVLRPGEPQDVTIYYDITDCHVVASAPQQIPVRVQGWYGQQNVDVALPPLRPYRNGGWSVSHTGDPKAVQWQRFLADHVCEIPYPDGL